jgi:hypothetical protein
MPLTLNSAFSRSAWIYDLTHNSPFKHEKRVQAPNETNARVELTTHLLLGLRSSTTHLLNKVEQIFATHLHADVEPEAPVQHLMHLSDE